ncbi:MAG: pyruvate kinase [Candidatus Poseidoniaceae archaeon]|nr:pyruvate kinase [Candidatus Poseidoniaceae archaeon]
MRRTRIIGTIGPASDDPDILETLLREGLDITRLNYSHGDLDGKTELIAKVRAAEKAVGKYVGILADLPGPKLRLGLFPGKIDLVEGQSLTLDCGVHEAEEVHVDEGLVLPVPYEGLSLNLRLEDPILLNDGLVRLKVVDAPEQAASKVGCVVIDSGPLSSRKGINVPATIVDLPSVGLKDKNAIAHAIEHGADFIAVSYVRKADDIKPASEAIKAAGVNTPIIAKIEHPAALRDLDAIVEAADILMVARGDLGVEIPLERVPAAQERILAAGMARGKPVIVATQMLESMCENPRPTRAEVTDVATAIRQGASAVMLSGETASGNHPITAIQTMAKIATAVDEEVKNLGEPPALAKFQSTRAVSNAAITLATGFNADHLMFATEHGTAPRLAAAIRPPQRIFAVTNRVRACRRVTILPGVVGYHVEELPDAVDTLNSASRQMLTDGQVNSGETVVAVTGAPLAMTGRTNTIRLLEVREDGTLADLE